MLAAYSLWAAELGIEALGAYLAFRKRNWIVFAYFAFLTVSDVALTVLYHHSAYGWAYWTQRAGKLTLLLILACWIVGKMVRERNASQVRLGCAIVTILGAGMVAKVFSDGQTVAERLLDAAMAANLILLVILTLGWIGRRGFLTPEWRIITAGFLVLIGSDLLITWAWTFWEPARHLYPLGVIPAYGMWNWAMWRVKEPQVRLSVHSNYREIRAAEVPEGATFSIEDERLLKDMGMTLASQGDAK